MHAELALVRADVDAAIARVLDSGVFIGGAEVKSFEQELARAANVAHAVGVSSGTDALVATLMALGVGPGSEVVTTAFTFFATAGAATRLGARVVFAEIDATTLNLDPLAAASACSARTRAVIPVHLFGHPATLPSTRKSLASRPVERPGAIPVGNIARAPTASSALAASRGPATKRRPSRRTDSTGSTATSTGASAWSWAKSAMWVSNQSR